MIITVFDMNIEYLLQDVPSCTSFGRDCYVNTDDVDDSSCIVDCTGLYADVDYVNSLVHESSKSGYLLKSLIDDYEKYKRSQIDSFEIVFNDSAAYGNQLQMVPKPYEPLRLVQIYFDTATYDKIVRDKSVTLADQLGAIGGTMGLFAGFSFLSALEIVYFLIKYVISVVNRKINV